MITSLSRHISLVAVIMLLSVYGSTTLLADDATVLVQPEAGDSLSGLLKNILRNNFV